MVVPAGFIALLDAVEAVAADRDPEAMKATRPPEVAAFESARKYQAARAASVSITNAAGKKYRSAKPAAIGSATPKYDSLPPESRAKVDRLIAAVQTAATSPPHPPVDWAQIEKRQRKAMEDARARLLQALADGVLRAQIRDAQGYPHDVPPEPWCGRGASWAMQTGSLTWHPPGRLYRLEGRVELPSDNFGRWLTPPPSTSQVAATIAAETRVRDWLIDEMQRNPDQPTPKDVLFARAEDELSVALGTKARSRAWADAVKASGAHAYAVGGARRGYSRRKPSS